MIKHVVIWKFKEENKEENMKKAKQILLALPAIIPEIKKMEVYFDISHKEMSMDLMLDTEFETVEAMNTYAVHPEHVKVAGFIRGVVESRVVLDAEI